MKTVEIMEVLSNIALFKGLTDRQLRKISDRVIEQKYQAGTAIIDQGKVGFGLFIILSGAAEVQYTTDDNMVKVVNTLGAHDFFGEIALLDDGPRTASVIATEDMVCLFLDRIDFTAILLNDAEMGVMVATQLAKRIRKLLETMGGS